MKAYRNLGGTSLVEAFESDKDSIKIKIKRKGTYVYNSVKPGQKAVRILKILATAGIGVSTFLDFFVKRNYFQKL